MDRINLDRVLIDPTVNGYVVGFTRWRHMWEYNYTKRRERMSIPNFGWVQGDPLFQDG